MPKRQFPQAKICGLTDPSQASACADLGADAIGLVFYPPSPRHVSLQQAAAICAVLPDNVTSTGVFVNPDWDTLAEAVAACGLKAVQLHGQESPEFVTQVAAQLGVRVIKALFGTRDPGLDRAKDFKADAFLAECGRGTLPGGNAMTWDWGRAGTLARAYPTLLAGGLDPDNVFQAVEACMPGGVDASSGLEAAPGRKDLKKVERFLSRVRQTARLYRAAGRAPKTVF